MSGTKNNPGPITARDGKFLHSSPKAQQVYLRGLSGPGFPTGASVNTNGKKIQRPVMLEVLLDKDVKKSTAS